MRTTITIAPDVFAEMERLRRDEGLGPSEALNTLARRGLNQQEQRSAVSLPAPVRLGLRVDVSNVAEVLDLLEDE